MRVSLLILLLSSMSQAQTPTPGDPSVLRVEWLNSDGHTRISSLQVLADQRGKPLPNGTVSAHLLFSNDAVVVYERMELDANTKERHTWLTTGHEKEAVEYLLGLPEANLTEAENGLRIGMLRAPSLPDVKTSREDAHLPTVQLRIQRFLAAWRPETVTFLRNIYTAIATCHLRVAKGDILPLLFPAITSDAECPTQFHSAVPDPIRDQQFLVVNPELGEILKRPAKLLDAPK
jgi:hypothetical protein